MTEALIINAAVLTVILESDLGPHRKITWFRIVRPLVTALVIVPFFIKGVAVSGAGLVLELALITFGVLLGWLATTQMGVYLSQKTGRPVTRAGLGYASIWIVVSAARVLFSYGSDHWFSAALGTWMADNRVGSAALTDSLIFMALAMVITRVAVMGLRARRHVHTARRVTAPPPIAEPARGSLRDDATEPLPVDSVPQHPSRTIGTFFAAASSIKDTRSERRIKRELRRSRRTRDR